MDTRALLNSQALARITLPQWKEICRELSLHTTGRKDELISRVSVFLSSDPGRSLLRTRTFSPDIAKIQNLLGIPSQQKLGRDLTRVCVCGLVPSPPGIECRRCLRLLHLQCVGRMGTLTPFECPLCQLRQVEPFESIVDTLLPPVHPCTSGGLKVVPFQCSEDQYRMGVSANHSFQIRCMRLDSEGYAYHWPKDCVISLNNQTLYSFTQLPSNSARKRKDTAVSVSNLKPGSNEVIVIKEKEEFEYAFGIFIVERLTADRVLKAVGSEFNLSPLQGKAFIRSVFDAGSEVPTDICKQSVKCPLTRLLPADPVRGTKCRHIQCFDLEAFIIMQEKARTNKWKCPICGLSALHLIRDKYMKEVLTVAGMIGSSLVEFSPDGSYFVLPEPLDDSFSDDEPASPGVKRKNEETHPAQLAKKANYGEKYQLQWKHFSSTQISEQTIQGSEPYLKAAMRSKNTSTSSRNTGESAICAIEVED